MPDGMMDPISVQRHLQNVSYPASKQDLIAAAKSQNAPEDVLEILSGMADKRYETPADLMQELGGGGE